jgi:hypothetical protein
MSARVNPRSRMVLAAQEAFRRSPDTRMLHRQLAKGNPYAHAKLRRHGLVWFHGAIRRTSPGAPL